MGDLYVRCSLVRVGSGPSKFAGKLVVDGTEKTIRFLDDGPEKKFHGNKFLPFTVPKCQTATMVSLDFRTDPTTDGSKYDQRLNISVTEPSQLKPILDQLKKVVEVKGKGRTRSTKPPSAAPSQLTSGRGAAQKTSQSSHSYHQNQSQPGGQARLTGTPNSTEHFNNIQQTFATSNSTGPLGSSQNVSHDRRRELSNSNTSHNASTRRPFSVAERSAELIAPSGLAAASSEDFYGNSPSNPVTARSLIRQKALNNQPKSTNVHGKQSIAMTCSPGRAPLVPRPPSKNTSSTLSKWNGTTDYQHRAGGDRGGGAADPGYCSPPDPSSHLDPVKPSSMISPPPLRPCSRAKNRPNLDEIGGETTSMGADDDDDDSIPVLTKESPRLPKTMGQPTQPTQMIEIEDEEEEPEEAFAIALVAKPYQSRQMRNIGNSCFINASLQALASVDEFVQSLSRDVLRRCGSSYFSQYTNVAHLCTAPSPSPLTRFVFSVLQHVTRAGEENVMPPQWLTKLREAAGKQLCPDFDCSSQQDSHEFFSQLLDHLKDELDNKSTFKREMMDETPPAPTEGLPNFGHPASDKNPVGLFEVNVTKRVGCSDCLKTNNTIDVTRDIQVALNGSSRLSIQQMVEQHLEREEVELKCESCGSRRGFISHSISKVPECLVVVVKRYTYGVMGGNKCDDEIDVSRELFLKELMNDSDLKRRESGARRSLTAALAPIQNEIHRPANSSQLRDLTSSPRKRAGGLDNNEEGHDENRRPSLSPSLDADANHLHVFGRGDDVYLDDDQITIAPDSPSRQIIATLTSDTVDDMEQSGGSLGDLDTVEGSEMYSDTVDLELKPDYGAGSDLVSLEQIYGNDIGLGEPCDLNGTLPLGDDEDEDYQQWKAAQSGVEYVSGDKPTAGCTDVMSDVTGGGWDDRDDDDCIVHFDSEEIVKQTGGGKIESDDDYVPSHTKEAPRRPKRKAHTPNSKAFREEESSDEGQISNPRRSARRSVSSTPSKQAGFEKLVEVEDTATKKRRLHADAVEKRLLGPIAEDREMDEVDMDQESGGKPEEEERKKEPETEQQFPGYEVEESARRNLHSSSRQSSVMNDSGDVLVLPTSSPLAVSILFNPMTADNVIGVLNELNQQHFTNIEQTRRWHSSFPQKMVPVKSSALPATVDILGDGNCLFRCISWWLFAGEEKYHHIVRKEVCDFMETFKEHFTELVTEKDYDDHLREMRVDGTWGTQTEMIALATMCRVYVYSYIKPGGWTHYRPRFSHDKRVFKYELPPTSDAPHTRTNGAIYLCNPDNTHFSVVVGLPGSVFPSRPPATASSSSPFVLGPTSQPYGTSLFGAQNNARTSVSTSAIGRNWSRPLLAPPPKQEEQEEEREPYVYAKKDDPVYSLSAVVLHCGSSLNHGHYTAFTLDSQSKKWLMCNDSIIAEVSESDVLTRSARRGYMFVYRRRRANDHLGPASLVESD